MAYLTDATGMPIDNAELRFVSDGGEFDKAEGQYVTTKEGFVLAVFTPQKTGSIEISAAASGRFATKIIEVFTKEKQDELNVTFTIATNNLSNVVSPSEKVYVHIFASDNNANMLNGAIVHLQSTSDGSFSPDSGETKDGWFSSQYTAPSNTGVATLTVMVNDKVVHKTLSVR